MKTRSALVCGVGGHGVLTLSSLLAEAALRAGLDVRKSEVHGMSQRGGAVVSHVRWGDRVWSALIPPGEADLLVALELLEALRWLAQLRPDGRLLVAGERIVPPALAAHGARYPTDPAGAIRARVPDARFVSAAEIARGAGAARAANVVLLGALSPWIPEIPEDCLRATLTEAFGERWREINLAAFSAGRALAETGAATSTP